MFFDKKLKDRQTIPLDTLCGMPTIASQFPLTLGSGFRYLRWNCTCASCRKEIPDAALRGEVTRPRSNVAVIEAAGSCKTCRAVTLFLYHLHDDGVVRALTPAGWEERVYKPVSKSP